MNTLVKSQLFFAVFLFSPQFSCIFFISQENKISAISVFFPQYRATLLNTIGATSLGTLLSVYHAIDTQVRFNSESELSAAWSICAVKEKYETLFHETFRFTINGEVELFLFLSTRYERY